MAKDIDRNARCHCGSGKKYKNCHGAEKAASGRKIPMGYVLAALAILAVVAVYVVRQSGPTAPPGKVWSAEHGHWHDAP